MRSCALPAIFVLSCLLSAAGQLNSYQRGPDPTDTRRYTLSGTVINSVTGEPIRRALVTLFSMRQLSAMTDSDGHFEFPDLPRNAVSVTAQKPGYFTDQELSSGRHRPKLIEVGPESTELVIKLVPEAIISGRIVDTDGLPIPQMLVRAVTQKVMEGRKEWTQGTAGRTDADGYFRMNNLMPGSYFVIAGPGHAQAFVADVEDTADLGYPAVVYPGPTAPMRIIAGQQVEINLTIKPEPFYSVTGSVTSTAPGNQYFVQLVPHLPGGQVGAVGGARIDPETGTFTIPRVARGDYTLHARGISRDRQNAEIPPTQFSGSVPISVRGNVMGVSIPLETSLTIPVNVRVERTKTDGGLGPRGFPAAQVRLMPLDQDPMRSPAFSTHEDPKDFNSPLVLRNALPGKYRAEVMSSFGEMYVASAKLGMIDLMNEEVTLTRDAAQSAIEIVIRDDSAYLLVKLTEEAAKNFTTVLVVPERGSPALHEVGGGSLGLPNLRPGSYTILAFADIGNLEYMNRSALEPYLSRGVRITLTPNQQASVSPEIIKAVKE